MHHICAVFLIYARIYADKISMKMFENEKLKTNLKEVGGKDTYEYLYGEKNENQLELFDE